MCQKQECKYPQFCLYASNKQATQCFITQDFIAPATAYPPSNPFYINSETTPGLWTA